MDEAVPGYPCTSRIFDDLPARAPLTAEEARMIDENNTLDQMILVAQFDEQWDDTVELMERKDSLEKRFHRSRERTWRVWRDNLTGDSGEGLRNVG